jgi:hypothetical protein|tara:strand:+ start:35 stop:478 length:444 start_codon:yes stop_codon:yes gene_type:complete
MSDIPLNTILGALDNKRMDFYDTLTAEQQKKVAPFLLNRYMSLVKGNQELAAYYLMATNQRVNTNYFALSKHPKLVWQLLCTVSPGMGKQFHQWVGHKKKGASSKGLSDIRKQLSVIYPNMKEDELDLMSTITTKKELKELAKASGE